jgi:hypothetical protein
VAIADGPDPVAGIRPISRTNMAPTASMLGLSLKVAHQRADREQVLSMSFSPQKNSAFDQVPVCRRSIAQFFGK